MSNLQKWGIACTLLILCTSISLAHGDLDKRIAQATTTIKAHPDSAFLYFKRAKLYLHHEDYQLAIKDLDHAKKLGYQTRISRLVYARSHQRLSNYEASLLPLEEILQADSNHVLAIRMKAEVYKSLKKYTESGELYEQLIKKSIKRLPENYLDAANVWLKVNTETATNRALDILQNGLNDFGNIFTLQEKIRSIHLDNQQYEAALAIQKIIIEQAGRKERPYLAAAKICLQMKTIHAAKNYLQLAQQSIEQLPLKKQNTPIIQQLKKEIKQLYQQI